ncbi:MAG: metallophosphoesterase [Saprospiraceae bacterium]|nr:metallophosphoesterase [Saprospiraceae bacterium]
MGFFILLAIIFLIEIYAFQGFKVVINSMESAAWRMAANWAYWLISILLLTISLFGLYFYRKNLQFPELSKWTLNIFISIFITKIIFILFVFSEDVYRFVFGIGRKMVGQESDGFLPERRLFFNQLGLLVASVPFVSFLYGITKGKYHFKIHTVSIEFEDLPEEFDGFRIAQFSDFHSGSFDNHEEVARGLQMLQAQNCDLIVFTGDLVNNKANEFLPYQKLFKDLSAPFGKYSILGNHDYGDYTSWPSPSDKQNNFDQLCRLHAELGFQLLRDEHNLIEIKGQSIAICGVENWGIGFGKRGNLAKALNGVDEEKFKILLSHDPSHWEHEVKMYPSKVQLCLSGHTHGAQMGVEIPGIKFSPVQFRYAHWAGLKEEGMRYHYINRGFGYLGFGGRVGIWPEITVLELKSKEKNVVG